MAWVPLNACRVGELVSSDSVPSEWHGTHAKHQPPWDPSNREDEPSVRTFELVTVTDVLGGKIEVWMRMT